MRPPVGIRWMLIAGQGAYPSETVLHAPWQRHSYASSRSRWRPAEPVGKSVALSFSRPNGFQLFAILRECRKARRVFHVGDSQTFHPAETNMCFPCSIATFSSSVICLMRASISFSWRSNAESRGVCAEPAVRRRITIAKNTVVLRIIIFELSFVKVLHSKRTADYATDQLARPQDSAATTTQSATLSVVPMGLDLSFAV